MCLCWVWGDAGSALAGMGSAQCCVPVQFMGSLLSLGRMDNGEACFILSSRNEVDRTAAVSPARGWHGQGWGISQAEGTGVMLISPLPSTGGC